MALRLIGVLRASLPRLLEVNLPFSAGAGNGDEGHLGAVVRGARAYLLQVSAEGVQGLAGGGEKGSLQAVIGGTNAYTLQVGAQEFLPHTYAAASIMDRAFSDLRFALEPADPRPWKIHDDEKGCSEEMEVGVLDKISLKVTTNAYFLGKISKLDPCRINSVTIPVCTLAIGTSLRYFSTGRSSKATPRRRLPKAHNETNWSFGKAIDRFLKDMGYKARGPLSRAFFVFMIGCQGFREAGNLLEQGTSFHY